VLALAHSRSYRFRKFVFRQRWPITAAVAVLASLSIGLGLAVWQMRVAQSQKAREFFSGT
jgi:cytochrome oxidase assembly protein ShyY1